MRKLLILLMAMLLPLSALEISADEKKPPLKIPLRLEQGTKNVRGLVGCSIESAYYSVLSGIHTITSVNLGEFWMTSFDSSNEQQSFLQISGTPGYYEIEYITESGDIYEGEFYVN